MTDYSIVNTDENRYFITPTGEKIYSKIYGRYPETSPEGSTETARNILRSNPELLEAI